MSGLQRVWTTTGIATKGINFRGYQRQQMVNLSVLDEQLFFCNEKTLSSPLKGHVMQINK